MSGRFGLLASLSILTVTLTTSQWLTAQQEVPTSARPAVLGVGRTVVRGQLDRAVSARDLEIPQAEPAEREGQLVREVLDPELLLTVHPRHSRIIRTRVAVERVSIADPSIVQMNEFDPFEIEFIGGDSGQTTLTLWLRDEDDTPHTLRYLVRCLPDESERQQTEYEYALLQDRINELFPNSQIQLFHVEDKLIVRGQAHDAKEARDILRLLGQRITGQSNQLDPTTGGGNPEGNETVDLGNIDIINLMRVPGEHQVMLKVRIAELSRNAARELGVNVNYEGSDVSLVSTLTTGSNISAILDSGDLELFLRAFSTHGYGKILAEPTLVTISGRPATFLAGGEFAVPTAVGVDGIGAATTTFRGFGTQLSFTPTVIDKDQIRLQVSPSFSTLNKDATVRGIPGLNSRSVDTTVDLREGQWLAIAGLIQDEQGGRRSEVPFLRRIPGVRHFFANQNTTRDETELVVLVSPQLVHPLEPDQAPMVLPGMEITDPTDKAFFLGGLIEGDGVQHRSTVWPQYSAQAQAALAGAKHARARGRARGGLRGRLFGQQRLSADYCGSESYYISGPSGFSQ